jgi:elongation factor G
MAYGTQQIRNVALAGHSGAGKTTLFEALLQAGGTIQTAGSVERGTTVYDLDAMEKERGHSLNTAIASIDHGGIHVNLIDSPGFPDFRGPALSALSAVETACVVVNAAQGIEYGTRRMMEAAKARGLCRVLVVNRIDAEPGKLAALIGELRSEFGAECLPINLPAKNGSAVVDCFFNPAGESDIEDVASAHQRIIDQVVEVN